jgi:hypothetical protein
MKANTGSRTHKSVSEIRLKALIRTAKSLEQEIMLLGEDLTAALLLDDVALDARPATVRAVAECHHATVGLRAVARCLEEAARGIDKEGRPAGE